MKNRRDFIKKTTLGIGAVTLGQYAFSAKSYKRILGSNDRVRIGLVGFSGRTQRNLLPAFFDASDDLNMEIVAVSDIWNRRRDEAKAYFKEMDLPIETAVNNEELYEKFKPDAVMVATADFQHALHTVQAIKAGCDVYVEKPFAETMDDANEALDTVKASDKIVQIGSQRRSGENYNAANKYLKSGEFGDITMVEMTWNVNQPGRWRRPDLVKDIKESDVDWKRYLMNRPYEPWNPRKYVEYRLFWPYSSGIPGQWMCHQIDTIHWFTGYNYPRSVSGAGGLYVWKDGRENFDTLTAVFDYGPENDINKGFQAVYTSRQHNSAGLTKELYFSVGGTLNLGTNKITSEGGLTEEYASRMGMKPRLLEESNLPGTIAVSKANTGKDSMTIAHMRNWMECIRNRKKTNAPVEAGYNHAVACIMANAATRLGKKAVFDKKQRQVIVDGKPFKY